MERIVINTTVISNFALTSRMDILKDTVGEIHTTEEVVEELKIGMEKGIFQLAITQFNIFSLNADEEAHFSTLNRRFGKGEASCLAIALSRNLRLLTDDFDVRKFAQRMGIPISGTIGVLVMAVEKGIISRNEANKLLLEMIEKGFRSPIRSLDEL